MNIDVEERGGVTVVAVEGSVDALTAGDFLQALEDELSKGNAALVADLSGVDYASSAGLRTLLAGVKASRRSGGDLRLCGVQKGVEKVLAMSGFTSILKIYDDADAAVASFAS
jgi:anti-sigma B factor antagonist